VIGSLPDVRNYVTFAAYCAFHAGQLTEAESELRESAEEATRRVALRDTAFAERDASQVEYAVLQDQLRVMRAAYETTGAVETFGAILGAKSPEARLELADARARAGQSINVLASACEHHIRYRYPVLDIAAQKANCTLSQAVSDMHGWNVVCSGIKRHIAAAALAAQDGQVSFPSSGGKTNELLLAASNALGQHADAVKSLAAAERRLQESRGN